MPRDFCSVSRTQLEMIVRVLWLSYDDARRVSIVAERLMNAFIVHRTTSQVWRRGWKITTCRGVA